MPGGCKMFKTETGECKISKTETGLMNYRHDRYMPGESKIFQKETGLMNYRHVIEMSSDIKFKKETGLTLSVPEKLENSTFKIPIFP